MEEVTPELRSRAKAVNFGIVYGIGDYSLSQDLGISRKQAGEYIRSYLNTYPGVEAYLTAAVENARRDGFTTTRFGRKRFIPELSAQNKNVQSFGERVAKNSPIQGTAADLIKLAMIRVDAALRRDFPQAKLILQVHDELIVECPEELAAEVAALVSREMEQVASLNVPLTAEAKWGKSWYDAK
jgi:DNA polymerase-1